jgi:hypothetical protein
MQLTLDDGKTITVLDYSGPHDKLMEQIKRRRAAGWNGSRLFCPSNYPGQLFDYDEYLWYLKWLMMHSKDDNRKAELAAQMEDLEGYWEERTRSAV